MEKMRVLDLGWYNEGMSKGVDGNGDKYDSKEYK